MKKIILNKVLKTSPNYKKYFALVDDDDFEKVNQYNWHVIKLDNTFYAMTWNKGNRISMHTLITGFKQTDHIDHYGLNNQRNNLRETSGSQNNMNMKKTRGASKYKGVSWHKHRKKWIAAIKLSSKQIYLGYFTTEEAAGIAYNEKAKELFGPYANLNNIPT